MGTFKQMRRATAVAVAGLFAIGGLGVASAPASATTIYGSGAALQGLLQNQLIPDSGLTKIIFTATSSGAGFNEFGQNTGVLDTKQDPTAQAVGQLDAYVATDSGPTVAQLINASKASGGSQEITVPVAQTPLDILLSLPHGVVLNSTQNLDLRNLLLGQLFAGTVPSKGGYATNTWGALLENLGLTETSSASPSVGQFNDTGAGDGSKTILVQVRKNGAGTTLNLKQYLQLVDSTDWGAFTPDQNAFPQSTEWPAGATITASPGWSKDSDEVSAVDAIPGSVGYATQGDAAANVSVPFTNVPLQSTDSKSTKHQLLYPLLQDDGTKATSSKFADPENASKANVYSGANIQLGSSGSGVGAWIVPTKSVDGGFDQAGSWDGTRASDPDVFDHAGSIKFYPLVAVAYDLAWDNYSTSILTPLYTLPSPAAAQSLTQQYLEYVTNGGQSKLSGPTYYAPLPSGGTGLKNIQNDASKAASDV
jgi:hypothetical protein